MFDDDDDEADGDAPITQAHICMIVAGLHDQGRTHVLADMVEGVTNERPPDGAFHPRKFPIRDPEWRLKRKKLEKTRGRVNRRSRETEQEKAARVTDLKIWKAANPDKMAASVKRRLERRKQDRKTRDFVAVDLEGFDTGRYFTDDRRDYGREMHESIARGDGTYEEAVEYLEKMHVPEEEKYNPPFDGWTVHDRKWYLAQHDLTKDDPHPSEGNRKPRAPEIYIEHRPFLFGAGNDHHRYFLTADGEWTENSHKAQTKTPLSGYKILNAIADLKKMFPNAIFVTFAFGYDVAQILRCLDADTAGQLQAGEIVTEKIDDDGAPYEEIIEANTFFWNEFAISCRRGKMFRVGRLKDPANPYKFTEIKNPEKRQAYIDAGREPVMREIDYKDDPVTLNDVFGFFQTSFIEAYETSNISFTLEEAKILVEGKKKRRMMASLPMDEVRRYQEMELRVLCRMMDKVRETMNDLGLQLPHWQGAGAISSAMANKHRAHDFYPSVKSNNYKPVQEWAHYCFAGGRIEMIMQGRAGSDRRVGDAPRLFGYDITSAYPSIQYSLPAMALPVEWETRKDGSIGKVKRVKEGKWIWREGGELTEDIIRTMSIYSMTEVEFSFPEKCFDRTAGPRKRNAAYYPLFYRREDGSILFPAKGIGRYYRDELLAAFEWVRQSRPDMNEQQHARTLKLRGGGEFICPTIGDLMTKESEAMKENCPSARIDEKTGLVYPFHYIKNYYDQRALYPRTDARNQYLKLGINGAWGKTAQSIGGKDGRPPPSASPWYAGVVTSGIRAKCCLAGLNAPWNVIHFATDGMQSNAPLNIENSKKLLGEWEMKTFTRGVYVKPGIYAFANDFLPVDEMNNLVTGLDALVEDHLFKGKSRGVGLRSILGEDGENDEGRNIQGEWFEYLDALAEDCYGNGRSTALLPHKKLLTFGAAASCEERWPMCGNWIESSRIFKMDIAGVKRAVCWDDERASSLIVTRVAKNDTPKTLSARHQPEWLRQDAALIHDLHENQDLALAHDWDFAWDIGQDE